MAHRVEGYYDMARADEFDMLFAGTYIYDHPTPEKNAYLMLKFNFSQINPEPECVRESFHGHVKNQIAFFVEKYHDVLGERCLEHLKTIDSAYQQLEFVLGYVGLHGDKTYVLVDEYDNFTNTILATQGQTAYQGVTQGEGGGFLRFFFSILKGATDQMESGIGRMFITGVSPVTLDDVTSGFNIGKNTSLDTEMNAMLGFTEQEVRDMLAYYHHHGALSQEHLDTTYQLLHLWYGNYRFAANMAAPMFNTTMVLYFLDQVIQSGTYPDDMIDPNVRIDYTKLRHLVVLDKQLNGNFSQIATIVRSNDIAITKISRSFPAERLTRPSNFLSLLFFLGLLSYTEQGMLCIPNETVRRVIPSSGKEL